MTWAAAYLGISPTGTQLWNGNIAEMIVYNRLVSDSDRNSIESYMLGRYQVYPRQPVISPGPNWVGGGPTQVTITADQGVAIMYTIDGSTPTPTHGTLYSGAFTLSSTATVQAITFV